MKFGIIGTGWITHAFLDGVYKNGGELVAIYSRSEEKGLAFGQKYNVTNVYTDMASFLNDIYGGQKHLASASIFKFLLNK